ncbi:MAG: YceI family protein [Owenweeksia sp.]|nr:YceI family protein [Owenweeksia sp.]
MKMLLIATLINLFAYNSGDLIATYKTDQAQSSLKVSGTSTVHDWEMEAKGMNGVMNVDLYEDSMDIKNLSLTVEVNSLKSGKSVMDGKTYDALKEEKYPTINYKMTEAKQPQ